MRNEEIVDTLSEIRNLMERSSKVLSLSGSSSLLIGFLAIIGAFAAGLFLYGNINPLNWIPSCVSNETLTQPRLWILILLASLLITAAVIIVSYMSYRRAKRLNIKFELNAVSKKMLVSFFVPLIVGGLLSITQIINSDYAYLSSNMLVFYGIALISISSLTYSSTKYLGFCEIIIGIVDSLMLNYSLIFWMIGFGILHIIYGLWFHFIYEKKYLSAKTIIK